MDVIFALATGALFGLGVFQILRRDLIKAAMGFAILFTAINLFIFATGAYDSDVAAYTDQIENGQVSDPLVQALVLTAIVVSFGALALLLAVVNIVSARYETLDSDQVDALQK
ncbi:MAG: cation:proton antiporter [Chloroflexi bacterium]|nr:cation:proton antiporter [Chloroflexota bacterium]